MKKFFKWAGIGLAVAIGLAASVLLSSFGFDSEGSA